jgi:glucans biosynthesis protein C
MNSQRRHDLDWLRVLVFGLLILYHIGMFFVPWTWHIENNKLSNSLTWPMWFINQWRLPLLFIISGMGTRFALSKRNGNEYLTERTKRLVIPLLFGMLVIVAPQVYVERMVESSEYSSFWEFYPHYFNGVYPDGNFSWHHLWFLPYLFVYSVILAPVFLWIRNHSGNRMMALFTKLLNVRFGLLWLALPLILIEIMLKPHFPVRHNLLGDWYAFSYYLFLFLYGYLCISAGRMFWDSISRKKRNALMTGIITFIIMALMRESAVWIPVTEDLFAVIRIINLGAWCIVIFGYGAEWLNRPGQILTYCNQAVYPFYIVHQTITVFAAWYIMDLEWGIHLKFLYLTVITFSGSWVMFELVKRNSITRVLFGLKNN